MQAIAEQQAQAAQIAMETEQRQAELELSQIENNLALAQERRARTIADIGLAKERESEVTQNNAKALLDNAKTYAEIEQLDRDHFLETLRFAHEIKQVEQQEADVQIQKDINQSEQLKQH